MRLDNILTHLRALAPEDTALPHDPIGLLLAAPPDADISKVALCLDATPAVARRAAAEGVGLLIAHHPLIYHPLKRLSDDPVSQSVTTLVKSDIALYAMHTNWDRADGGINDTLAGLLELQNVKRLGEHGIEALPRIGELASPLPLADFARQVQEALTCAGKCALRVSDTDPTTLITRVAVCGGAGAELSAAVQSAGADAYITSDVRHHEFLDAAGRGLALLDAGHQATETPGMRALLRLLPPKLPGVEVLWAGD